MKIVPIAAILLGALGSIANAQSAVSDVPAFNLAMNNVVASQWVAPKASNVANPAQIINADAFADQINQDLAEKLAKKLDDNLTREMTHASND